jgi:hypothetical protein
MINVLLDRCPRAAEEVFRRHLKQRCHIKVVNLTGGLNISEPSNRDCKYFLDEDLMRGVGVGDVPWVLTDYDQALASKQEGLFFSLCSRFSVDQNSFTPDEILDHYYQLINFWSYTLDVCKINACFAFQVPHDPSSFSLYVVSKINKVPYIYMDNAIVLNKYRFYGCSIKNRMLLQDSDKLLDVGFGNEFDKLKYSLLNEAHDCVPVQIAAHNNMSKFTFKRIIGLLRVLVPFSIKDVLKFKITWLPKSPQNLWKSSRHRWDSSRASFNRPQLLFFLFKEKIRKTHRKYLYRNLCVDHKKIESFIYFACPNSPEASTLPMALHSRGLFIILKQLSDACPVGTVIAIKENPIRFKSPHYALVGWRSKYFYSEILSLKNVVLISDKVNTHELISASIGTATVNGTVGIESVLMGKNCITFSSNWYDGLDGIFKITCPKDLSNAMDAITNKYVPNPHFSTVQFGGDYIQLSKYVRAGFNRNDLKAVASGFISALNTFSSLDDRKWEV